MQVGHYEVVKVLGEGGMGRVLLARDPVRQADVAIKVLLRPGSDDGRVRFEREQRLLATLGEAEGFVPILDRGEAAGRPYLVMPFLAGGTLRPILERGPMPIAEAVRVVQLVAMAVARAHERGIVHRDLKPENIIFTAAGAPLVADLGLAKHFLEGAPGASQSVSITRSGDLQGTAGYMALEQMHDAKTVGPPADVFALGAILYEALSGEPAFLAESPIAALVRVEANDVTPLAKHRPDAPRWLTEAVMRALARDQADRFPDAGAFARALAAGAGPGRRRRLSPLVLAPLVLAATVAAVFLLAPRAPPPATGAPPVTLPVTPPVAPASPFPDECRGFLATTRTKLLSVLGRYAGKLPDTPGGVAISPDGRRALTGDRQGRLWLWDLATFGVIRELAGPQPRPRGADSMWCTSPVFVPGGKRALSGSEDGSLRIWDLETGALVAALPTGQTSVSTVAVSSDGALAATGGSDGTVFLWDLASRSAVARLEQHWSPVTSLTFSRDGRLLLSGSLDVGAVLWDVRARALLRVLWKRPGASATALSPDGKRALVGLDDDQRDPAIHVLDATTGAETGTLAGHRGSIRKLAFAGDGHALSASSDGTVRLWSPEVGAEVRAFEGHRGTVTWVAASTDGSRILSCGADQQTILWDADTGADLRGPTGAAGPLAAVSLAGSGRLVATGGLTGVLHFFELPSGRLLKTIAPEHPGAPEAQIQGIALTPDGRRALLGTEDGAVELRETASGRSLFREKGHAGGTRAVALLDAQVGVSGGNDGFLKVWNLADGTEKVHFERLNHVAVLALATRGSIVLAGCAGNAREEANVSIVDVATTVIDNGLEVPDGPILATAISPDGRTGASGGFDGFVRLHDLGTRTVKRSIGGHRGPVTGVAVGTDFVLSGSLDGTVRISSFTGEELDRIDLATSSDRVLALALAGDQRSFVVATVRGVVLRFELRRN